ncbi:MAG TPA: hypothetical protein VLK82_25900 [Candidatus Tectomicrobia bacterium]|nr:hypothetical protein [Candidatus Tectomicrobia bacterium]
MAEEQPPNTSSEGTPASGEKAPSVTEMPRGVQEGQGSAEPVEGAAGPGERGQRPEKESQVVAEEQPPNTSSENSPSASEKVPVTEKPVPSRRPATPRSAPSRGAISRKISQYVVSVDDATGSIVKIEKLDEKTGKSREFTQQEYTAAYSFASCAAPYYAAYAASLYDPLSSPAVQAYVKAIADYLKAFAPGR